MLFVTGKNIYSPERYVLKLENNNILFGERGTHSDQQAEESVKKMGTYQAFSTS